jgi:RNA polymerase sigma factor (sigma-70 family)
MQPTIGTHHQEPPARLAALVESHGAGVVRYLRSLVGDGDLARDLAQDTFLKLHAHADGAGAALVFTVARSCALDHLRRQKVRRGHEVTDAESLAAAAPAPERYRPDRDLENRQLRDDLLAALATLPEDQRSVFHLSEIEGLAYAEIAAILEVSPGTIASRKHHAVRRLREYLRRRGHGA